MSTTETITAERDAWCAKRFADSDDRDLAEWSFAVDATIIEHNMFCCCDEDCTATPARKMLAAITYEMARRDRTGERWDRPGRETFEERHAPFGTEWQLEQRDRIGA
jgi:hypothetical protein